MAQLRRLVDALVAIAQAFERIATALERIASPAMIVQGAPVPPGPLTLAEFAALLNAGPRPRPVEQGELVGLNPDGSVLPLAAPPEEPRR